jgi:uncharacterized BrkB/YihY/UPF0761 family membrane protein
MVIAFLVNLPHALIAILAAHVCFHAGRKAVLLGVAVAGVIGIAGMYATLGDPVSFWPRLGVAFCVVAPYMAATMAIAAVLMDSPTPSLRNIKIGFVVSAVVLAPATVLIALYVGTYAGYEGP